MRYPHLQSRRAPQPTANRITDTTESAGNSRRSTLQLVANSHSGYWQPESGAGVDEAAYERRLLDALTGLATLGLRGDADGVARFVTRLVQRPLADSKKWQETALRLRRIVADADEDVTRALRRRSEATNGQAPHGVPLDASSNLAVLREEWVPVAPAPVLNPGVVQAVGQLIDERHRRDLLVGAGVAVTRTVLFTGPPGVGKTMTARYLAAELSLPLYTIDLAGLMSSYLGRTGQNLRQALDHARRSPSVLFIDEFDALAKRRDDETDVGELKRIVNVLLLELDQWPVDGMLIAATNHPELLDRAIWRRFDRALTIGLPEVLEREAILRQSLDRAAALDAAPQGTAKLPEVIRLAALAFEGWTPADLVRWSEEALRVAILTCQPVSDTILRRVKDALASSTPSLGRDARIRFAQRAVAEFGWSQREIARLLDVSHTAVSKWIAKPRRRRSK